MQTTDQLNAALNGRYRIERELGTGGMATVYLARDLKHDRAVAIKVLHRDLARSLTGERFLREIAITARLNHPHILALLDSGTADDGELLYYVMPVATGESLRERLARSGPLPISEALRLATDVTEALAAAHSMGIIHRDVKPENILLSGGHAVVADFGIAKAVGDARDAAAAALTSAGVSLGTPAYMAPEQAAGDEHVDQRADIYAVGAVLFEMVSGSPAFTGTWQKVVMEKMANDAPSLSSRSPSAPRVVVELVASCLAREADKRPASAEALLASVREIMNSEAGGGAASGRRARRMALTSVVVAAAVVALAGFVFVRDARARWVHETAIPTIQRMIEADQLDSAFELATRAAERAPNDSSLDALWFVIAQTQTFLSDPPGAVVTRAALDDTAHWIPVGTTPTAEVRIPRNAWFYRYSKAGYRTVTVMGARIWGSFVPIPSPIPLRPLSDPDTDMVLLRGHQLVATFFGLPATPLELSDYLMDRLEITNRQYKAFVDAGGYQKSEWWDSTIVKNGAPITFDAAMKLFVDRTGRPGPSTWEGGAPVDGTSDLPVGGVSWYEARAYARFAHKELPTVYEWNAAAIPDAARWLVPNGRYESTGPVRGGSARSVGPRGVYDMAGNVREWTANARERGSRYILGGGWSDPAYVFSELYAQPELDRSAINGIRLIRRLGSGRDLATASAPIPVASRNYDAVRPVDEATYRGFLALYDYDHTPLNAKIVQRDTTPPDWIREDVEYDLPGGHARLPAVMFLPKHVKPPYQTLVVWPATDARPLHDRHQLSMAFVDFYIRSGRAVLYPIYEHTYGRGDPFDTTQTPGSIAERDQMLRWAKELRRSVDYVSSRPDVDTTRLAFAGASWGSRLAATFLAVEPRFRAAVLDVPGLSPKASRPEVDPVNFLPRIRIPVLMLSGKYDSTFPLETSQKPFFRLLGSPGDTKKHVLFEGGHFLPRPMMVAASLEWLDKYLGAVSR